MIANQRLPPNSASNTKRNPNNGRKRMWYAKKERIFIGKKGKVKKEEENFYGRNW